MKYNVKSKRPAGIWRGAIRLDYIEPTIIDDEANTATHRGITKTLEPAKIQEIVGESQFAAMYLKIIPITQDEPQDPPAGRQADLMGMSMEYLRDGAKTLGIEKMPAKKVDLVDAIVARELELAAQGVDPAPDKTPVDPDPVDPADQVQAPDGLPDLAGDE